MTSISTGLTRCIKCGKEKTTSKCWGCLEDFCYHHLGEHRQELNKQFNEIEIEHDLFHQTLNEQTNEPRKHPIIQQIDQWKQNSIDKIRQIAEETRLSLFKHITKHIVQIEDKLTNLMEELQPGRTISGGKPGDFPPQNFFFLFSFLSENFFNT